MAQRQLIQVGRTYFQSKTQAKHFFSEMLNRYNRFDIVKRDDANFLYDLIQLHPNAEEKIGVGIKEFYVDKSEWGTLSFYVKRFDDSHETFSYLKCLKIKS